MANKFRKVLTLSLSEWAELIISAEALFEARIIFANQPAKTLLARLKKPVSGFPEESGARDQAVDDQLVRLEWALSVAARILPWRTDCLIRCIAADKILRRRNLEPHFYLGVTQQTDTGFGAHAWIRCRGISVAGGEGKEFEVLIGPEELKR
ncbi:lasso peptide biosynthesis B2 protein [Falsihalocynthiibacter sp. BN13B15]|uniref:lasso peptide biosynthesis B2 protein n=1 Tax=Falsihalocynthiibacter sp. BN13B15 TaxID=3240871 RepID=UPI00350EA954